MLDTVVAASVGADGGEGLGDLATTAVEHDGAARMAALVDGEQQVRFVLAGKLTQVSAQAAQFVDEPVEVVALHGCLCIRMARTACRLFSRASAGVPACRPACALQGAQTPVFAASARRPPAIP